MSDGGLSADQGAQTAPSDGGYDGSNGHDGYAEASPQYAPQGGDDGYSRLHARMDEISQRQIAYAQALGDAGLLNYDQPGEYDDGEYEGYAPDEYDYGDFDDDGPDLLDDLDEQISTAVGRRFDADQRAAQAEQALDDRDQDFERLREMLPTLQDDETCEAIVHRAMALCEAWGTPEMINSPEFVGIIGLVAEAVNVEPGLAAAPRPRAAQPPPPGDQGLYGRVQLESAGGAGQHEMRATEVDWGDRIVAAAEKLRPRI